MTALPISSVQYISLASQPGQRHVYVFGKLSTQKPLFLYDLKNCASENLNYLNLEMLEVVGGIGRILQAGLLRFNFRA